MEVVRVTALIRNSIITKLHHKKYRILLSCFLENFLQALFDVLDQIRVHSFITMQSLLSQGENSFNVFGFSDVN